MYRGGLSIGNKTDSTLSATKLRLHRLRANDNYLRLCSHNARCHSNVQTLFCSVAPFFPSVFPYTLHIECSIYLCRSKRKCNVIHSRVNFSVRNGDGIRWAHTIGVAFNFCPCADKLKRRTKINKNGFDS